MKFFESADGREYFHKLCPYCREKVRLYRSNNDEAIMFDKQIYHRDCYIKSKSIKRTCKSCGKIMYFANVNDWNKEPFVVYQSGNYCMDCFESLCVDGVNRKSRKWKNAQSNIDKYVASAKNVISTTLEKKKLTDDYLNRYREEANSYAANVFVERDVDDLIRSEYDIMDISRIYCDYLRPLYKGTSAKYEGYQIPPEHLLEMWKTKLPYLRKVYQKNITKGKQFTPTQHALYDLAILVQRYEGFLEWKNKQKVLETNIADETDSKKEELTIAYERIKPIKASGDITDEIDDILNDIFE